MSKLIFTDVFRWFASWWSMVVMVESRKETMVGGTPVQLRGLDAHAPARDISHAIFEYFPFLLFVFLWSEPSPRWAIHSWSFIIDTQGFIRENACKRWREQTIWEEEGATLVRVPFIMVLSDSVLSTETPQGRGRRTQQGVRRRVIS